MDATGALLSVQTSAEPWIAGFDTSPTQTGEEADAAARSNFFDRTGVDANEVSAPTLVIVRASDGEQIVPQLA